MTIWLKTNMHHIHTSIVSRHLATRGNNKILHTPPPHTSSSEERLPPPHSSHPCPTQNKQISLPQIILTQSRYQNTSMYAPSVTSTYTTHIISSTAPTYAPHCHPWICGTDPARVIALLAPMDREAGWWTTSRNIGLPPLARGHGSG